MEQKTPEWFDIRKGKITASNMSAVLAKGRGGGESKTRKTYMLNLLAERLSGMPQETYCDAAMRWGTEQEPFARDAYEASTLSVVEQVGFVEVDDMLGMSPDGLIDVNGGLEIKCGNTTTHIRWLLENRVPPEHIQQIQSSIWMSNREWWDFCSFDPRLPQRPIFIKRAYRDEKKIVEIEANVQQFIEEMLELEKLIKKG